MWEKHCTDLVSESDKRILKRREEIRVGAADAHYGNCSNHPVAQAEFWRHNRFSNGNGTDPTDEDNGWKIAKNITVNNFYTEGGGQTNVNQTIINQ